MTNNNYAFSQLFAVQPIASGVTLPSAPIEYTPATSIQQQVYALLASGNAFNTASADNSAVLKAVAKELIYILLYLEGVSPNVKSLAASADRAAALNDHLNYHYENLIDNLQLVSSGISDAIGYGVIGTAGAPAGSITNPTASYSDFFGSITGKGDKLIVQSGNQIVHLLAHASAMVAGAIIFSMQNSGDSRVDTALGTLTTYDAVVAALANLTKANLNLLGTAMNNLGALMSSGDPTVAKLSGILAVANSLNVVPYVSRKKTKTTTQNTSD